MITKTEQDELAGLIKQSELDAGEFMRAKELLNASSMGAHEKRSLGSHLDGAYEAGIRSAALE